MARNKVKDWTNEITELEDWSKLIDTDKLVVAEIYSAWFGFCETYTPVIDKIMASFKEEQQQTITWTRLNVAQLEKENSHNPLEMLEKWASYESPKPLYVFIKDKKILATVTEANGGKMKKTVTACVNGEDVPQEEPTPEPEPVEEEAAPEEAQTEEAEATEQEAETAEDANKIEEEPVADTEDKPEDTQTEAVIEE